MVKRRAYFLDADYTIHNDETYLRLLLKGRVTTRLLYRYDPYFYVDAPEGRENDLLKLQAKSKDGRTRTPLRYEWVERTLRGAPKKILKLYCRIPPDVPLIRALVPFPCYEHNIPFGRRWMMDAQVSPFDVLTYEREKNRIRQFLGKKEGRPQLSALAFDIETYNPVGAPREAKDPIIMISYAGRHSGVITYKPIDRPFVQALPSEKEIIERLNAVVKEENPDVIFGYNSANFDLPYLEARARVWNIPFHIGRWSSRLRKVRKGMVNGMALDGRIHVDVYSAVRFFGFIGVIKAQQFGLDNVAQEVLGKKKVAIKKDAIWKMWDEGDVKLLAEYSHTDARITQELGQMLLPLQMELATIAKLPLFDISIGSSGQLVENLLMFKAAERRQVSPNRPSDSEIRERTLAPIQGAFVKLPAPGIYDHIAVMDFRGLYPSIIVSYNIDPDTLDAKAAETDCFVSPTGARFRKDRPGLIPGVLDYLIDFRAKLKNDLKKLKPGSEEHRTLSARVQAVKILTNSAYGYLGYARARWYNRECAESVTAYGRKHITEVIEKAEKAGFNVLYSDTDSIFMLYNEKQYVLDFMKQINDELPDKMELELEGFYPRGVFVGKKGAEKEKGAKKKYALLAEDGRIKVRGFELVRRDWSKMAKETQRKVLEAILKEGSKEKAVAIVRETIARLRTGQVPLEDLAIVTQLNKAEGSYEVKSPELGAATRGAKRSGTPIEKGSMISYVVTRTGKTISEKAEMLEFAKDYDVDYYINNQLLPSVMKILKELGYDEYDLKVGGKQKGLGDFF